MSRPTASVVASRSPAGSRLAASVAGTAADLGFRVEVLTGPTPGTFARAVGTRDAVVVDASVEVEGGSTYPALVPRLLRLPHVLAASRTPLPVGLAGRAIGHAPAYPARWSNDALLERLRPRLAALGGAPRSRLSRLRPRPADRPGAFVGCGEDDPGPALELAGRLAAGDPALAPGRPADPVLLAPGELAFAAEVLTWDLRWQLAAVVADRLRACGTYWLCLARDAELSWWNRLELLLVAYLDRPARLPREVLRYDPGGGAVDTAAALVPRLSADQWERLDRLLTGSRSRSGTGTGWAPRHVPPPAPGGDPDELLSPRGYVEVSREVLVEAATRGSAAVGPYRLTPEPMPRHVWHPSRLGRPTAPPGSIDGALEPLPVFRAHRRGR